MPVTVIRLSRSRDAAGELVVRFGVGLLDEYLEFLADRCRPNTVLAVAYDLKVFRRTPPPRPETALRSRVEPLGQLADGMGNVGPVTSASGRWPAPGGAGRCPNVAAVVPSTW
jgi:hypothetical protein